MQWVFNLRDFSAAVSVHWADTVTTWRPPDCSTPGRTPGGATAETCSSQWCLCSPQLSAIWHDGGHKVREKNSEFSRLFHSHNYTFPEIIATKILSIWQHLGWFLATFSPCTCRNGCFSWHLLDRVATPWDHNDPVYPINSCFMQIFNHTKIILLVIIFPWSCTELPEISTCFPGSENSPSIPGFFLVCGHPT